jgi:hypothetical protein
VLCEEPSTGEEKKQSYDDYRFMKIMTENVFEVVDTYRCYYQLKMM